MLRLSVSRGSPSSEILLLRDPEVSTSLVSTGVHRLMITATAQSAPVLIIDSFLFHSCKSVKEIVLFRMGEFTPKFERDLESRNTGPKALPTAGAIAVRNEKGEVTMQKVKVVRYMAGKMFVSHSLSSFGSENKKLLYKDMDCQREESGSVQ